MAWPIGRLWRACVAGVACGRRVVGVGVRCAMAYAWRWVGVCGYGAMALCRRVYGVGMALGVYVWITHG